MWYFNQVFLTEKSVAFLHKKNHNAIDFVASSCNYSSFAGGNFEPPCQPDRRTEI